MSWSAWLNEWIEWDRAPIRRYVAIRRFVRSGLIPFLESKGYRFGCSSHVLQSRIATGLYNNQMVSTIESDWEIARINNDYLEHDIDHYWHVLDSDTWEAFWSKWGVWTDVSLENWRGPDRRMDIAHYVWTQISLEGSSQTQVVNELVGLHHDRVEDWYAGTTAAALREDVYLREAMESGEWGGYRK